MNKEGAQTPDFSGTEPTLKSPSRKNEIEAEVTYPHERRQSRYLCPFTCRIKNVRVWKDLPSSGRLDSKKRLRLTYY